MHKAATAASRGMLRDFGEVENLQVSRKGPADFVSRADTNAERLIKSELQKNNDDLIVKLQQQEEKIVALHEKIKLMNISKSVDTDKNDLKATRLKINEYVREIDKCIALLNK